MEKKERKQLQKHSKRVRQLRVALPSVAFLVAVSMLLWPVLFKETGHFSLIDFAALSKLNKTAESSMKNVRLYSSDNKNEPFMVTADEVLQQNDDLILLKNPKADFNFSDDVWTHLSSPDGVVYRKEGRIRFNQDVEGMTDNGYEIYTKSVEVRKNPNVIEGFAPISVVGVAETLKGDAFLVSDKGNRIFFKGHVFVESKKEPMVTITSENGLKINRALSEAVFFKKAVAVSDDKKLQSDKLSVFFEQSSSKREIHRILAEKDVVINVGTDMILTGKRAEYSKRKNLFKLFGSPAVAENSESVLKAVHIEYDVNQNIMTARRNVFFEKEDNTIQSQKMRALFTQNAQGKRELSEIFAEGNVSILTKKETVRADKGHYDVKKGIATLTENVFIQNDSGQLRGDEAIIDMTTGQSVLKHSKKKRIRGVFFPE